MITTSQLRRVKRFQFEEKEEAIIKTPKMNPLTYLGLYSDLQKDYQTFGTENIPDRIIRLVCVHFDVEFEMITGACRKRELVIPRQICMYFFCKLTKTTLRSIGKMFGNRDHATVLYSKETVQDLMDTDRKFRLAVEELEYKIRHKQ